jgi:hypothetical protein
MGCDPIIQTNGPYLRLILPDLEDDWLGVSRTLDEELEEGIRRVEIVAPCYRDPASLEGVRELVESLDRQGIDAIVEWQGRTVVPAASG